MNETSLPVDSSEPNAPTLLVLDSNLDGFMEYVAVGIEDTADFVAWDPTTSDGAYSLSGSAIMSGKEITFGVYLFIDAESGDTLLQARRTSGDERDFFKVWDGVRAELVANARKVRQYMPSTVSRDTSTGNEPAGYYSNRKSPPGGGSFDDPDLEQSIAIYGLAHTLHPPSTDVPVSHIRTNDDPPSISTGFIRYYYATYDTESPNDANYFVHDDLYYTPARSPVLIIRVESPLELYRDGSFVGQTSTSSNAGVVQRLRLAADQFVVHTSRAVQDADLRAQEASMEDDIVVSSKRVKLIRAVYYPFESQIVTPRFLGDGVGAHTPLGNQPESTSDLFPLTQDSSGSSSPTSTTANTETTTATYPFLRVEYYLDNDAQRFQDDVLYMFPVPFFHPRPLFKQGRWCESTQADNIRALQRLQSFVIQAVDDIRAREGRDIRLASATYYNKTWGRTELNRKIPIATPTDDDSSRYTVQMPPVPYATQQDPSISDDVGHDEPSHIRFRRQVIDRLRPLLRNYISECTPTQREGVKQNTLDKMYEVINAAYHEQANGPDERLDEAYMALQDLLLLKKSKPSSMTRKRAAAEGGDSSVPSEQLNDIAERLVTPLVQHCDRADAAHLMDRLVRTVQFCDQTTDIRRLLCDIRQILHEQGGNTQGANLPSSLHQEIQQFFNHTFHKDHTMVSCTVVLHNLRNLHQQLAASQVTL